MASLPKRYVLMFHWKVRGVLCGGVHAYVSVRAFIKSEYLSSYFCLCYAHTTMPFHDLCGHYLCTGKLSLSRKTLGIPLTVEDVLMQTHRHAHKTALKLMFCLVLLCPPQGSLRCSHSLIELASLGTVIH